MPQNDTVDRVESAANITLRIAVGATNQINNVEGSNANGQNGNSGEAELIRIPISRLDTSKDIEIDEVRENTLKANGYSVTSISYSGTMSFNGSKVTKALPESSFSGNQDASSILDSLLYDDEGVPIPVSIHIEHEMADTSGESESESYQNVLVTSESYESRSESATETSYDWAAMDRTSDQP